MLLLGERGVGKELFARALHEESPAGQGPFVAINCGAVSKDLLPSDLFGYVDGAFTGARRGGKQGMFEAADGGTLFMDEICELPLELQPQLLRVLQEREVVRLGDHRPRKINVRVIAATNRDLRAEVERGSFRLDLYYRLCVFPLRLPPLRERAGDLEIQSNHLRGQNAQEYDLAPRPQDPHLLAALHQYRWPGNVRELRNVLESMLVMATGDHLTKADLPREVAETVFSTKAHEPKREDILDAISSDNSAVTMSDADLAALEREAILAALSTQRGNRTRAAK